MPYPNVLYIRNDGPQTCKVWPGGANDVLDDGAAGANGTLSDDNGALYFCISDIGGVRTWVTLAGTIAT